MVLCRQGAGAITETEERMEALELRVVERVVRDGMVQEFKVPTVDL